MPDCGKSPCHGLSLIISKVEEKEGLLSLLTVAKWKRKRACFAYCSYNEMRFPP